MFEIIKPDTKINFVSMFRGSMIFSAIAFFIGLYLIINYMNYGVDFRGGAEITIKMEKQIELDALRSAMDTAGFKGVTIQAIGEDTDNEFLIKVQSEDEEDLNALTARVETALRKDFESAGLDVRRVDVVGPKAGEQLRISGFLAMLWSFIAIMVYIALRFDYRYAPGAIISLIHDAVIILGIYAVCGKEFTLQTVAAVLAVTGYSTNDNVIIYDRIREHEIKYAGLDVKTHINNALNETLSRTIITSGSTFIVTLIMYMWGGSAISDFFFAMNVGIIVGTYSSIFVASPLIITLDQFQAYRKNKAKERLV